MNFKLLFAFAGKHCRCHQLLATTSEELNFGKRLEGLLTVLKRLLQGPIQRNSA
jgi:hypothetical protein